MAKPSGLERKAEESRCSEWTSARSVSRSSSETRRCLRLVRIRRTAEQRKDALTATQGRRKKKSPQLTALRGVFRVTRKSASERTASKNTKKSPRENERRPGEEELRERNKKPAERSASRTI